MNDHASTGCGLCASLRNEPFRLINRNEHAAALIIREPLMPFHALVLPVRHVAHCTELTEHESKALHALLEELTRHMDTKLGCAALAALNGARFRTQPHLHYQVLPVQAGLRTVVSAHLGVEERQTAETAELAQMAERIRW